MSDWTMSAAERVRMYIGSGELCKAVGVANAVLHHEPLVFQYVVDHIKASGGTVYLTFHNQDLQACSHCQGRGWFEAEINKRESEYLSCQVCNPGQIRSGEIWPRDEKAETGDDIHWRPEPTRADGEGVVRRAFSEVLEEVICDRCGAIFRDPTPTDEVPGHSTCEPCRGQTVLPLEGYFAEAT